MTCIILFCAQIVPKVSKSYFMWQFGQTGEFSWEAARLFKIFQNYMLTKSKSFRHMQTLEPFDIPKLQKDCFPRLHYFSSQHTYSSIHPWKLTPRQPPLCWGVRPHAEGLRHRDLPLRQEVQGRGNQGTSGSRVAESPSKSCTQPGRSWQLLWRRTNRWRSSTLDVMKLAMLEQRLRSFS